MAYVNNGISRSLKVQVSKSLGGSVVQGYPKTYDGQKSWGNPTYPTLTDLEARRLSDADFNARYNAFVEYVQSLEPTLDFSQDIVGDGAIKTDPSCLPVTTTTTTTTVAVVEIDISNDSEDENTVIESVQINAQAIPGASFPIEAGDSDTDGYTEDTGFQNFLVEITTTTGTGSITISGTNQAPGTGTCVDISDYGSGTHDVSFGASILCDPDGTYNVTIIVSDDPC